MNIIPAFCTPIYVSNIDVSSNLLSKMKKLEYVELDTKNGHRTKSMNVLTDYLPNLKNKIDNHINMYLKDMLSIIDIEFNITRSWAIKHKLHDYAQKHNHANSQFSGIYYVDCDNESGDLCFYNENSIIDNNTLKFSYKEYNEYNGDSLTITPKAGDLLLFPSHLSHSVGVSKSNKERYCVAFDIFGRGQYGTFNNTFSELKIG